jgi:hypothetical protein
MTFFFLFNFTAFALGIGLWNRGWLTRRAVLFLLAGYICFGYFFLDKI